MNDRFKNFRFSNGDCPEIVPGTLLVAAPALHDTPFRKTVVFVLQNNTDGTFGVVLNRPADEKIKFAWYELTGSDTGQRNIVDGGPIGGPIFAIHQHQAIAEMEMPGGIFVTSESDKFSQLVDQPDSRYRIVFGVAGWQRGQLNAEIDEGLWYQLDVNADQVFDDPTWMWEKSIRRFGQRLLCDVVGLVEIPGNPLLN